MINYFSTTIIFFFRFRYNRIVCFFFEKNKEGKDICYFLTTHQRLSFTHLVFFRITVIFLFFFSLFPVFSLLRILNYQLTKTSNSFFSYFILVFFSFSFFFTTMNASRQNTKEKHMYSNSYSVCHTREGNFFCYKLFASIYIYIQI